MDTVEDGSRPVVTIEDTLSVVDPPECIFGGGDNKSRSLFEALFKEIDHDAVFCYLNSFKQVRVVLSSTEKAKEVVEKINGSLFMGEQIKLRFSKYIQIGSSTLQIPEQDHLFLISPPSTPPVGWEQTREAKPSQPHIEEILHALHIASFSGEPVQVHAGTGNIPSIVLHAPDDDDVDTAHVGTPSVKISSCPPHLVHTARPP